MSPNLDRRQREETLLRASALFDEDWYLLHNLDVAVAGTDPVRHYLDYGAAEGRDPGPAFSTNTYLAHRADVAEAGINPLVHFLCWGITETEGRLEPLGIRLQSLRPS